MGLRTRSAVQSVFCFCLISLLTQNPHLSTAALGSIRPGHASISGCVRVKNRAVKKRHTRLGPGQQPSILQLIVNGNAPLREPSRAPRRWRAPAGRAARPWWRAGSRWWCCTSWRRARARARPAAPAPRAAAPARRATCRRPHRGTHTCAKEQKTVL